MVERYISYYHFKRFSWHSHPNGFYRTNALRIITYQISFVTCTANFTFIRCLGVKFICPSLSFGNLLNPVVPILSIPISSSYKSTMCFQLISYPSTWKCETNIKTIRVLQAWGWGELCCTPLIFFIYPEPLLALKWSCYQNFLGNFFRLERQPFLHGM